MSESLASSLVVIPASDNCLQRARECAGLLGVSLLEVATRPAAVTEVPAALICSETGLLLQETGAGAPGPVTVDFVGGAVAHRRRFGGGSGQQIAKAIGLRSGIRPRVADVTAGLGRDGFVLASLGCQVTFVERSPVIGLLLEDGLSRGREDPEVGAILSGTELFREEAADWLQRQQSEGVQPPQVVYLDPMFPHSRKTAQVKKEMRLFRQLIGDDTDTAELLEVALQTAENRVVVKRPRKAPAIEGPAPSFKIEGKSGRFDIYALKRL